MSIQTKSKQCSTCKNESKSTCTGCQQFFCIKDFLEHRQNLSIEFDRDVVRSYDELREQIDRIHQSEDCSIDPFLIIDQWEKTTIDQIHKKAEELRHQLIQMLNYDNDSLIKQLRNLKTEISQRQEGDFDEVNIKDLQQRINQLQKSFGQLALKNTIKIKIVQNNQIDWNQFIYIEKQQQQTRQIHQIDIMPNAKWTQNGITIAGFQNQSNEPNKLYNPRCLYLDDDQNILIADESNHRIVEWKCGSTNGQVIAGGNGKGNRNDQLNCPTNVIVDKNTNTLIICDQSNQRIVRWPRRDGTSGETIISNVKSFSLKIDNDGFFYVSDYNRHEVRRWRIGDTQGTLVAGGNGKGDGLNQLNHPRTVFVDHNQSVYVSDCNNHRVMKWMKDAKEGIVVAGGYGQGNSLTQLSFPRGIFADQLGTVYVADYSNHRIMRWSKGSTQGDVIVGGNNIGTQPSQFHGPVGFTFDSDCNLYVADYWNHRVQKFSLEDCSCFVE